MVARDFSRGVGSVLGLVMMTTGCMGSFWWKTEPVVEEGVGSVEARKPSMVGYTEHGGTLVVTCREDGVRVGFVNRQSLLDTRHEDGVAQAKIQVLPEDGQPWQDRWLERNREGTGVWFAQDEATEAWLSKPHVGIKFRAFGRPSLQRATFSTDELRQVMGDVRRGCATAKVAQR